MMLFSSIIFTLYLALISFYQKIIELSIIYKRQGGVFFLILDFFTYVVEG